MKIIVVTKGDERRWHTLELLKKKDLDVTAVTHDKDTARVVRRAFPEFDVCVSGTKQLVDKRNWILKNLVKKNEWFIGFDDNIRHFTMVRKPWRRNNFNNSYSNHVTGAPPHGYSSWREIYNQRVKVGAWIGEFIRTIDLAEKHGIPLVGVATLENPYFRAKRYAFYKIVVTKAYAMKNTGRLHFENVYSHDAWISAQCVAKYGKILSDSYLHFKARNNEVGGLGSREHREKNGLLDYLQHTVDTFPGLVRISNSRVKALQFRLTKEKSVDRWREEHDYL